MLPLRFWSCGLSSIILVCCFGVNDAIPFGSHSGGEVRSTASHETKTRNVTKKIVPDVPESLARSSHFGSSYLESQIKKIVSPANEKETEKLPEKCATEQHEGNQPFNLNLPVNASPIDIAGAFKVAGEPKAKRTSSVHVGEEITLCWIETTTIKEDPTFDPPKRLVVREFTISFENAATIPDDYLECAKLDGEISPGDVETVFKTSLREVIYENTRRSGVANFTTVRQVGPIVVREQKKIRCATGGTVSKDVYEWPKESVNPKKRVEIKVGPSIRRVDVSSGEEFVQCGSEDVTRDPKEDPSWSSVQNCIFEESCSASVGSSCEDGHCTTKKSLEEENATMDYSDINELFTAITGKPTTERSDGTETVEHLLDKPVRSSEDSCPENDPNCELGNTTMNAVTNYGNVEACSDEECTGSSSDESTSDAGSDENTEGSEQCAGENCTSKEGSSATTKPCSGEDCSEENLDKSTKATSDASEDTSSQCSGEDCTSKEESSATTKPCSGEDCSAEHSEKSTKATSDASEDTSSQCSGEDCTSKEESSATTKPCSGEDCSAEHSEKSTSDASEDSSSQCSGEDCTSKEESSATTKPCTGDDCSDENLDKSTKVISDESELPSSQCSGEDCTSKEESSATPKPCTGDDCSDENLDKSTKVISDESELPSSQCSGEDCTSKEGSSATTKPCSGEDCSAEHSEKSTSDASEDTSSQCSGEDCTSEEESSATTKPCSGEDCSAEHSEKSTSDASEDTSSQCSGEDCTSEEESSATTKPCSGEDCSAEHSEKSTSDASEDTSSQCSGEDCTSEEESSATTKPCSGEDCSAEHSEKSTKATSDASEDTSSQCSGEDCTSKEESSATTKPCSGEDCSAEQSEKSTKITSDGRKDTSIQCSGEDCPSKEESSVTAAPCSGEDCSVDHSEKSTKVIGDENKDESSQCSGENCTSKEESGITQPEAITTASNEPCQEGSESCACNGTLCMIHGSGGSGILTVENKLTGETAVPSVHETNETLLKDSGCDGDSEECSHLSETSLDEEERKKKNTLPSDKNDRSTEEAAMKDKEKLTPEDFKVTSITNEKERESLDTFDSTGVSKSGELSVGVTGQSCDGSESGECATVAPVPLNLSNDVPSNTENDSSSTERPEFSITPKKDFDLSETLPGESEQSSSCKEGSADESCPSTRVSSESKADDNATTDFSLNVPTLSESTTKIETPYDGDVTLMPTTSVESEPTTIEAVTEMPELIKAVKLSDEKSSSEKDSGVGCGKDSEEGSGDCKKVVVMPSETERKNQKQTDLPSSSEEKSTISAEVTGISSSTEIDREESTDMTPIAPSTEESSCDDSNESCFTSSSGASSEICKDGSSSGDCTRDTSSSEACDLSSGFCSSETNGSADLTDEAITTTTESTSNELEHLSTTIDNVSTTAENRRSTAPALSLASTPPNGGHKLALRIKVLLEHINERKKKQKLVQVEKHLLLNEKPEEHGNHSLVGKIRSLNNSMNMETFKSIFNYTAVENLTENFSKLTEFKQKSDDGIVLQNKTDNRSAEESTESQDNSEEESSKSESRRKREISIPEGNGGEEEKNVTDRIKVKAIKESLPGVNEDLQKGLDHVLYRISQELETPVTSPLTKTAESSPSKILTILADPDDRRVHPGRRRRAAKVGGVVPVEELEYPINGEKVDQWSNERFVTVADGGHVRSLLEFEILRAPDEQSPSISS